MTKRITSMTKQQMIAAIKECAESLGRVPSQTEAMKMKGLSVPMIRRNFGTYNQFLGVCKLEARKQGQKYGTEELLRDWARVVRKLKKIPSVVAYEQWSENSETPFSSRFGSWKRVPQAFKQYAVRKGWTQEWRDVLEIIDKHAQEKRDTAWIHEQARKPDTETALAKPAIREASVMAGRPVYGPMIRPYPMVFAPTNEDGVIFLFGSMAVDLGFIVTRLQGAFPDCEAMRRVVGGKLQPVRIEFEFESRNFLKHRHDVNGSDVIVCWEHNWPECPLEVIELKALVGL
jgi:hypothetical protein